jgi:tetratricopeptide (TPR) repeat protein
VTAQQRSRALLDLGRYEDAERETHAALVADPMNGYLHTQLAYLLHRRGSNERASAAATTALHLEPHNTHAAYSNALTIDPTARLLRRRAECLTKWGEAARRHRKQRFAAAEADLVRAVSLSPDDEWIHIQFARLRMAQRDHERAAVSAAAAVELDPLNSDAHLLLGEAAEAAGNHAEAAEHYLRAGRLDPVSRKPLERLLNLSGRAAAGGFVLFGVVAQAAARSARHNVVALLVAYVVFIALMVMLMLVRRRRIEGNLSASARSAIAAARATEARRPAPR